MSKLLKTLLLASATSAALLGGCANRTACCEDPQAATKAGAANVAIVNANCPISNEELSGKEYPVTLTRTVDGKTIGFCCEGCEKKFDKMPAEKQRELMTAATSTK